MVLQIPVKSWGWGGNPMYFFIYIHTFFIYKHYIYKAVVQYFVFGFIYCDYINLKSTKVQE